MRSLNKIGSRLRTIRKQRGLTQEKLGELAGVHYSYIGQVERGDKVPSLKTLHKLARALDTDLNYFLEEQETYYASSDVDKEIGRLVKNRPPAEQQLILEIVKLILNYLDFHQPERSPQTPPD